MKKIILCLLVLSLLAAISLACFGCKRSKVNYEQYDPTKYTESIDLTQYDLVFCDEFEGELNREIWGDTRQGYRRDGYWTRDLAFTDGDGHLIIRTEWRDAGTYNGVECVAGVYSGAVRTSSPQRTDGYRHGFGYYEIRCKLPDVEGIWHAFWMMCGDVYDEENGSTDGIEIDVFEYLPARDAINCALHWDGYDEAHKNDHMRFENTGFKDGEYHTFGMNWDENGYAFYIDGKKVWTSTGGGICQNPGYMKISTEYGDWGDWVGKLKTENLPVDWVIDYVKIYDKKA